MLVLCDASKEKKGKIHDNQDKETSTDEVRKENKRIQKKNRADGITIRLCVLADHSCRGILLDVCVCVILKRQP